jgi:tetratricopeptide (TPR) repeat protein
MQNLVSIDPRNQTYQNELATVLAWAAVAQRSLGNLTGAIVRRQRQIDLLTRALAGGATNVQVRQSLIPAHRALGILLASRGQLDDAIAEFQSAVAEADQLTPVEPGNNLWKEFAASARLALAKSLLAAGKQSDAALQTDAACSTVAQLRRHDTTNANLASFQTSCLTIRSRLALQSGATAAALSLAAGALASAQAEHSGDPVKDRYGIAAAYRLVGDVRQKSGDPDGAQAAWTAGLAVLPANVAEQPSEMQERAELLRRAGRAAEARPLDQRLSAIGYHSIT